MRVPEWRTGIAPVIHIGVRENGAPRRRRTRRHPAASPSPPPLPRPSAYPIHERVASRTKLLNAHFQPPSNCRQSLSEGMAGKRLPILFSGRSNFVTAANRFGIPRIDVCRCRHWLVHAMSCISAGQRRQMLHGVGVEIHAATRLPTRVTCSQKVPPSSLTTPGTATRATIVRGDEGKRETQLSQGVSLLTHHWHNESAPQWTLYCRYF